MPIINLVADASIDPLTLTEVKNFLRVDIITDDDLITRIIKTAIKQCELYTGKTLITKTYKYSFYNSIIQAVKLLYAPIQSISSVKVVNEENSETTINSSVYFIDTIGGILNFKTVPANFYRLDITYIAGYGSNATDVPEELKQAMLIHIARMYDDKNGYSILPKTSLDIYKKHKIVRF